MNYNGKADEILSAAETLFAKRGFERTPIADIAELAGVTGGTIIYYFKKKENLLFTLSSRVLRPLTSRTEARVSQAATGQFGVAAFVDEFFTFFKANSALCAVYLSDIPSVTLHRYSPEKAQKLREMQRVYLRILESSIARGSTDGSIAPLDHEAAAKNIMAMLLGSAWLSSTFRVPINSLQKGAEHFQKYILPATRN